jgi:hypothetical protein
LRSCQLHAKLNEALFFLFPITISKKSLGWGLLW